MGIPTIIRQEPAQRPNAERHGWLLSGSESTGRSLLHLGETLGMPSLLENSPADGFSEAAPRRNFLIRVMIHNFVPARFLLWAAVVFLSAMPCAVRAQVTPSWFGTALSSASLSSASTTSTLSVAQLFAFLGVAEAQLSPLGGANTTISATVYDGENPSLTPGLQGEYFDNLSLSGAPGLTQYEESGTFEWDGASPGGDIGSSDFSAMWTGEFVAPTADTYYFSLDSGGSAALYLSGSLAVSADNGADGVSVSLSEGQIVPLELDYVNEGPSSNLYLGIHPEAGWGPGQPNQPYPGEGGLMGEYFSGTDMTVTPTSVDWEGDVPDMDDGDADGSVQWLGYLNAFFDDDYYLQWYSTGGMKVWVDDTVVIDDWGDPAAVFSDTDPIYLSEGPHALVIQGAGAVVHFDWDYSESYDLGYLGPYSIFVDNLFPPSVDPADLDLLTVTQWNAGLNHATLGLMRLLARMFHGQLGSSLYGFGRPHASGSGSSYATVGDLEELFNFDVANQGLNGNGVTFAQEAIINPSSLSESTGDVGLVVYSP